MKRTISMFAAFFLAVVFTFGSQVASAFADTPDPSNFTLKADSAEIVNLDSSIDQFTAFYTNNSATQNAEVEVNGGSCLARLRTIPAGSINKSETYSCGSLIKAIFTNKSTPEVGVVVSQ